MAKNLVLGPILATLAQIWALKTFFCGSYFYYVLEIVARYHCMLFQGKLINKTWENGKKPSFGSDFGPLGSNLGTKDFFRGFYLY